MKNANQSTQRPVAITAGTSAVPLVICLPVQWIGAQCAKNPPDTFSAPQEDAYELTISSLPP